MLEPMVAAALAAPGEPDELTVDAAGIPFHVLSWGDADAPPVLLLHGVTSSARTWWRIGPAVASAGYRVVAPDLPGHGLTGYWTGHHLFRDNASDLVAFARAAFQGTDAAEVRVVGHSWGGMTAGAFPAVGYVPARLVLVDPPTIPLEIIALMLEDPVEAHFDDLAAAMAVVARLHPTWAYGDVVVKAEELTRFEESAVRAILLENGDWDGGLAALADPAARHTAIRLIRGDPEFGGLIPDSAVPAFEARIGAEHVTTIPGAAHSPQRTHPVETTEALLSALSD